MDRGMTCDELRCNPSDLTNQALGTVMGYLVGQGSVCPTSFDLMSQVICITLVVCWSLCVHIYSDLMNHFTHSAMAIFSKGLIKVVNHP